MADEAKKLEERFDLIELRLDDLEAQVRKVIQDGVREKQNKRLDRIEELLATIERNRR